MRRSFVLALAAALAGCEAMTGDFHLSGTVDVAPELSERIPKTACVLFVVAENAGGVPVAVQRIVNPEFPSSFHMGPEDLLVPAVRRQESLNVHAELNLHGAVGKPRLGDWEGRASGVAHLGDGGVRVTLDHQR